MTQLDTIKQRLARYLSEETNTDEKLEEGSISDWVHHGDTDMGWLINQLETVTSAARTVLDNAGVVDTDEYRDAQRKLRQVLRGLDRKEATSDQQ